MEKSNVSSETEKLSFFLSDKGATLKTLDFTNRIGSTPTTNE